MSEIKDDNWLDAVLAMLHSVVEYSGVSDSGRCGYCRQAEADRSTIGIWAHRLSVSNYNQLLDRGMRRSGTFLYKPVNAKSCCPQYTIRLDANKFRISRAQKRVLRRMNDFLQHDIRPKTRPERANEKNNQTNEPVNEMNESKIANARPPPNANARPSPSAETGDNDESGKLTKNKNREKGQKKKVLRRERAFQRMREKGIDIEEAQRIRREREESRRRTLESYILKYDPQTFKHKLEVRLVSSKAQEPVTDESFALYRKYQKTVHKDKRCSLDSFSRFLANSPLFTDEIDNKNKCVSLGSYHQQYYLDDRLIAVGVVDILPRCLSATYLFYDPDYEFLTLGTYTALREIAFTRELAKERPELHYYYMGYYIHSCQKMRYKGRFSPSELLCDRSFTWVPLKKCTEMMTQFGERIEAFAPNAPEAESCPVESVGCLYKMNALSYRMLLTVPDFNETKTFMEEYARIVGPVAREMLLYRE